MRINTPVDKFAIFGAVLCLCIVIMLGISACRKIDMPQKSSPAEDSRSITERFFTVPVATNEKVKAVAGYFSRENDKKEFVNKAVKNAGYPVWDKAMVVTNPGMQNRSETENDDSTIFPI